MSDIKTSVQRIQQAKKSIADAIEAKGVDVPSGTKIDGMSQLIRKIQLGHTMMSGTFLLASPQKTYTIDTGLPRIRFLALYLNSAIPAVCIVNVVFDGETTRYTACASYSQYVKNISTGSNTPSVSGGKITLSMPYDFVDSNEYKWFAFS